jgi:hypothetical protein
MVSYEMLLQFNWRGERGPGGGGIRWLGCSIHQIIFLHVKGSKMFTAWDTNNVTFTLRPLCHIEMSPLYPIQRRLSRTRERNVQPSANRLRWNSAVSSSRSTHQTNSFTNISFNVFFTYAWFRIQTSVWRPTTTRLFNFHLSSEECARQTWNVALSWMWYFVVFLSFFQQIHSSTSNDAMTVDFWRYYATFHSRVIG